MAPAGPAGRGVSSVSDDVDSLLGPKSLKELTSLEGQVKQKLESNEPIDVEYWEQLLRSIAVYKAKAELKQVYKSVIDSRLQVLKDQQILEADSVREKLTLLSATSSQSPFGIRYSKSIDPEPFLKIRPEDKALEVMDEAAFLSNIVRSQ